MSRERKAYTKEFKIMSVDLSNPHMVFGNIVLSVILASDMHLFPLYHKRLK